MQEPLPRTRRSGPRVAFVLDYIPDGVTISKEVVLTRDSYTDRWLGSLQRAGADVTKYVPWREAEKTEVHRHSFGHRVKLIPVTHPLIPRDFGRTTDKRNAQSRSRTFQSFAFTLNLVRELRADRIQLVHYANYFTMMFVLSPLASLSAPVVTWFTGGDVPDSRIKKWSWFFALRPAFRRAKGVMIGDYPERRRTLFWLLKGDNRKIKAFQLLRVDQKVFKPQKRSEARKELGYDDKSVELVSVLSLIPSPPDQPENRQPFTMLQTFATAVKSTRSETPANLTVIGIGPGLAPLKVRARDMGIADKIRFEGRVEHDRLSMYYAAANLVFVPYRLEALNETNVLAEAFSCERAVVAFRRNDGLPLSQPGGFLIGSDPAKGGPELAEILLDPETISKKSGEAFSLSPQFSLDAAAEELLSMYAQILGK